MSPVNCNQVGEEIQKLLVSYAQEANTWVHFSQRERQLNAEHFVQTVVLGWLRNRTASLNELAQYAQDLGLHLTGSALQERLDSRAVLLLAGVLQLALARWQRTWPLPLPLLQHFTGIYITDSTQIALPEGFAAIFAGNQGQGQVKLQVCWDYLHGNLAAVELEAGRQPDQRCTLPVHQAQPGSLQLFDLGYFKQEYLAAIAGQDAFFVSRYQAQTALYQPSNGERLLLAQVLRDWPQVTAEFAVWLGGRVKVPVRLLARRLTPASAEARRRKARRKARKQGQTCRTDYLDLLGWDILVTNLPAERWLFARVFDLYALRFQIEWLFRVWKAGLGTDELGPWRVERVLCQLYAHLLGALLTQRLTATWRWRQDEFSFLKTVQIIQARMVDLMRCLARAGWGLSAWLTHLEEDFRAFGRKTRRRKSPSTAQVIYNWGLS